MRDVLLVAMVAGTVVASAHGVDRPSELVKKLSDKSFTVRQLAIAELSKLGPAGIPALVEGAKDTDSEVAEQCRKLLSEARATDQREKLAVFLGNPSGPIPKGLAGAEAFFALTGDDKPARELYTAVMRNHGEAMLACETNPGQASELFNRIGQDINDRYHKALHGGKNKFDAMAVVKPTERALFFIFAADARVNREPRHLMFHDMLILNKMGMVFLTEGEQSPAMRKLFVHWLLAEPLENYQQAGFELAAQVKIPELLPTLLKMIEDPAAAPKRKAMAMIGLRQVGTAEHVKLLAPYLNDKTKVYDASIGGIGIGTEVQDVAMGMSVVLSRQAEQDFGLGADRFGAVQGVPVCLYYYGFADNKTRETAHKKWRQWLDKNPGLSPGAKPGAPLPTGGKIEK